MLSAMVIFVFTASLQLLLFVRTEIQNLKAEIPVVIDRVLTEKTGPALDYSLLRILLNSLDNDSRSLPQIQALLRALSVALSNSHPDLRGAHSLVLERAVVAASLQAEKLGTDGLEADILDHLEVTRRLSEDAKAYVQIQRRAFRVPGEWTQEWMRLARQLSDKNIPCTYILLMQRSDLTRERDRVESMSRFLSRLGWHFDFCDLGDVLDAFGGKLPTECNIEIIDNRIVKLHEIPTGRYQGGVQLKMFLFPLDRRTPLGRYVTYICDSAHKVTSASFAANTRKIP
jgi:hypothetical protein